MKRLSFRHACRKRMDAELATTLTSLCHSSSRPLQGNAIVHERHSAVKDGGRVFVRLCACGRPVAAQRGQEGFSSVRGLPGRVLLRGCLSSPDRYPGPLSTGACAPPPDRRALWFSRGGLVLFSARGRWLRLAPGLSLLSGGCVFKEAVPPTSRGIRRADRASIVPLLADRIA